MMDKRFEQKTYLEIDSGDFDDLVNETYNVKYEIVADEEMNNYSYKSYSIKKEEFDDYDREQFSEFLSGKGSYNSRLILVDMCNKELIEEGDYLIKASW